MKRLQTKTFFLVVSILAVITFSRSADALEIGARGYYWFPTLTSNIRVDGSTVQGTEFNLKDNLGLGTKPYPSVEVYGGLGKNHLSLMYTQADYSGSTTLSSPLTFNGTAFAAGTAVNSAFKIKMLDLAYKRDLIDMSNILAGFSLSAIGKIKYIEGNVSISQGNTEASNVFRLPIPMIGAGAHVGILANIMEARAELTGIAYSNNYLYEALADLSLTPFPFIDVHGGYKTISIHVDRSDLFFTSDVAGPFVAVTVGF